MTRRGEAWCGQVRCGGVWQGVKGVEGRIAHPWGARSRGLALLKGVDCLERIPPSPYFYVDVYMKRSEETFLSKVASLRRIPWGLMAPKKELPGKI